MPRRDESFDRRSLAASVGVHLALLAVAVWSSMTARPPLEFTSYEIELVSPPPAEQAQEETPSVEELVVERPDPEPPEPEPEEDPVPVEEEEEPEPEPDPEPTEPEPEPESEEEEEEPAPATTTDEPPEEAEESGEDINVRLEGVRRDYPAYYNNIITQIQRCFRWQGQGSWQTTVYFVIQDDGSVADMRFVSRSGNTRFDIAAMGAVECAGQGQRFGPLPEDVPFERLPIQFNFRPQGGTEAFFPEIIEIASQP